MNLKFLQRGRCTVRYHGIRMHDHQRIDAHSYGVAMLALMLISPGACMFRKAQLMEAGLKHDLAEHVVGDIPAPTKRQLGVRDQCGSMEDELMHEAGLTMPVLDAADQRVLKLADAAEGCLHCIEERRMGNQDIARIFYTFWSYCIEELGLATTDRMAEPGEEELRKYIAAEWQRANGGEW